MSTCQIMMSTCQIFMLTYQILFGLVCMALIGQEHVFKIHFLTNELLTSQHKDMKSQHK